MDVSDHFLLDWLQRVFLMNFSGFLCDLQIMLILPLPRLACGCLLGLILLARLPSGAAGSGFC